MQEYVGPGSLQGATKCEFLFATPPTREEAWLHILDHQILKRSVSSLQHYVERGSLVFSIRCSFSNLLCHPLRDITEGQKFLESLMVEA